MSEVETFPILLLPDKISGFAPPTARLASCLRAFSTKRHDSNGRTLTDRKISQSQSLAEGSHSAKGLMNLATDQRLN